MRGHIYHWTLFPGATLYVGCWALRRGPRDRETDRDRQRQTETDREKQRQTEAVGRTNSQLPVLLEAGSCPVVNDSLLARIHRNQKNKERTTLGAQQNLE